MLRNHLAEAWARRGILPWIAPRVGGVRVASGFTLVELLVVIGTIGLLASMLLPALGRATAKARQTNCLSNARQLALAVAMYVDEHAELFPPSADYSLPSGDSNRVWTTKALPYLKETGVFICPAAVRREFPADWAQRGVGSIGYTTATAFDPSEAEGFATPTSMAMMESPSLATLFGDTPNGPTEQRYRGFTFDPYNGRDNASDPRLGTPLISERDLVKESPDLPPSALKPLYARHRGRVILILADGHAAAYTSRAVLAQENGAALHWRFRPRPPLAPAP